jgi:hypothetical protein
MADCGDLSARLKELDDQLAASEALERQLAGKKALLDESGPQPRKRRLKMFDGSYVEINPQKFWDQVEKDAIAMGEADIAAAVRKGFDTNARPISSKGLNINYSQLPPTEENIAKLLEVLNLRLNASKAGVELRRPFTEGAANAQFRLMAQAYGAEPRALAEAMKRKLGGIDQLPINAYIVNRVKRDAVRYYTDVLEDVADLLPTGAVDAGIRDQAANAARWAHYWEQFDNQVSSQIARALRTRQFGDWANENIFTKFEKDIKLLTIDEISGGSLAQQVLEHIDRGDDLKLRRMATAKRLDDLANRSINEPNFMTQVEILNNYRKDNLFSSAATWLIRNPSSAFVSAFYALEDVAEGALRYGVDKELGAMTHAARSVGSGMASAWRNAWDNFAYGKPTFSLESTAELSPDMLLQAKQRVIEDLNQSWDLLTTPTYHVKTPVLGTAVTFYNVLNLGFRKLFGSLIESKTGTTAGYTPAFRLLNGGDEVIRKTAFDWKVNHEAYLRASKEAEDVAGLAAGKRGEWIRARAEELASKAVFDGLMTDDQLAQMRLRELGVTAGDMDNEQLRLVMFNNLHGTPNSADELGKLGALRSDQVTFTQKLDDRFTQGVQMMRANPIAAWVIPVWRTPANGVKWILNHDLMVRVPQQLYMEAKNAFSVTPIKEGDKVVGEMRGWARPGEDMGKFWKGGAVDPELLAKSRAATLASMFLGLATQQLWSRGVFSDGGPTDEGEREIWMRQNKPYSFSLSVGAFDAAKFGVGSIDLFDLMGLQADMLRAFHEGRIDANWFTKSMQGLTVAYGRVFMNKASLDGVTSLLNAVTRAGQGDDVDWFEVLAKQTNGVLPMSGLLTQASRSGSDPNLTVAGRRTLTPAEYAVLQKDQNWETFQSIAGRIFANYPVLGSVFPQKKEERDWLGSKVTRPLGLPIDSVTPFMPVMKPRDPLYDWMEKHGLGMKPRPEGKVSGKDLVPVPTTMTLEQEATYRREMYSIKGEMPVAAVLGKSKAVVDVGTARFSIDHYVQGRTMADALRKLSQDPEYNLELDTPGGPSLKTQPNTPASTRTNAVNDPRGVYDVFSGIVSYYDQLALQSMAAQHPEFREMALANLGTLQNNIRARLEASPMGLIIDR